MSRDGSGSIWEHTDELVKRLKTSIYAIVAASLASSFFPVKMNPEYVPLLKLVIDTMKSQLLPKEVNLIALNWLDVVWIYVLLAAMLGFIFASPVVAFEIYMFIIPALYPHERKNLLWFVIPFTALFIIGASFAYFILLPLTFNVILRFVFYVGAAPFFSVMDFFTLTILGMLTVGLLFTFPSITTLLVKMGVISPATLSARRREVLLGLTVLTAIITPDTTGITMLILLAPLAALYELGIIAAKIVSWQSKTSSR